MEPDRSAPALQTRNSDANEMTINVKFLSDQQIEQDAQSLLTGYYHQQGQSLQIPVPVDDILETYLGLSLAASHGERSEGW